jgi:hypothetical protein
MTSMHVQLRMDAANRREVSMANGAGWPPSRAGDRESLRPALRTLSEGDFEELEGDIEDDPDLDESLLDDEAKPSGG